MDPLGAGRGAAVSVRISKPVRKICDLSAQLNVGSPVVLLVAVRQARERIDHLACRQFWSFGGRGLVYPSWDGLMIRLPIAVIFSMVRKCY